MSSPAASKKGGADPALQAWELHCGPDGAQLMVSGNRVAQRKATGRLSLRPAACASITATASQVVLPAAAAAAPAPVAALAQDVQHGLLMAAAAVRALLSPPTPAGVHVTRRRRSKPAPKRAAASVEATAAAAAATLQPATAALGATAGGLELQHQLRAAHQFLAGGVAGAVSKTLVAPLERITTLVMVPAVHQRYDMRQAVRLAWREGGLRGLYRGHAATLVKIFPASAIQFAVFNGLKDRMLAARRASSITAAAAGNTSVPAAHHPQQLASSRQQQRQQQQELELELANHERLVAGAAAGAAAACACYPLESMRTAMSVAGGMKGSLLQVTRSVLAAQGLAGLYRGFRASLVGDVLGNALGFTFYEAGNRLYRDLAGGTAAPPHFRGVIGACSAACVLTLTMPLEVVRRRLQVQGLAGRPVLYRGTLDCLAQILKNEGLQGFYAASVPSYLKVPASIGVMYFCFELLMSCAPPQPAAESHASTKAQCT